MATASAPAAAGTSLPAAIARAFTSTLGLKLIMAVTGLLFFVWLLLHLSGNMAFFAGAETMNKYAGFLKATPAVLWGQRIGLALVVVGHVVAALKLQQIKADARPQEYRTRTWRKASFASRTMIVTGVLALAYLVFHLFHFTIFPSYPGGAPSDPLQADVWGMVSSAFRTPWKVLVYTVGMACVGLHLTHGIWSGFQTLGLNGKKFTPFMQKAAVALGVLVALAFLTVPFAALLGLVKG